MKKFQTLATAGAALLFALTLGAGKASAGICLVGSVSPDCNVALDIGNGALTGPTGVFPGYAGPYASGLLDFVDSTHLKVSFAGTRVNLGGNAFQFEIGDMAFNLDASGGRTFSTSNLKIDGVANGDWSIVPNSGPAGSIGNVFGVFNTLADGLNGGNSVMMAQTISFDISLVTGSWGNAGDLLTLNEEMHSAAAHIFVFQCASGLLSSCDSLNTVNTGAIVTGKAAWPNDCDIDPGSCTAVPEPKPVALLGLGLMLLALGRRRMFGSL